MTKLNSVDYKDCVGKVFKSNSSGLFKIVKYVSSRNIEIEFLDTGFRLSTILLSIEMGSVEDKTIPPELNTLIIKCDNARGSYPVGVTAIKKRNAFSSRLSVGGFRKYLGYYKTPEEAFYAYKEAKEEYVKEQANKWKDQIDPRAYKALMNYEVEIDD